MANTSLRISNSGRESLERTRAMTSERLDGGMVSTRSTFLQIFRRTTGCPHYSMITSSTTCANCGRNPIRDYGGTHDFRVGNCRPEEPASRAPSERTHDRSRPAVLDPNAAKTAPTPRQRTAKNGPKTANCQAFFHLLLGPYPYISAKNMDLWPDLLALRAYLSKSVGL